MILIRKAIFAGRIFIKFHVLTIKKFLEQKCVIEKGKFNFASPMVCAKKKDGSLRLSGDFRALNLVTVPDLYPLPRINVIK